MRPHEWRRRDWVLLAPVLFPESLLHLLSNESGVCQAVVGRMDPRGELRSVDVVLVMTHLRNIKIEKENVEIFLFLGQSGRRPALKIMPLQFCFEDGERLRWSQILR